MIITRSPYRISFFGGGTDYHTWYEEHGGEVLSTSIDHYNYISCRYLIKFFTPIKGVYFLYFNNSVNSMLLRMQR